MKRVVVPALAAALAAAAASCSTSSRNAPSATTAPTATATCGGDGVLCRVAGNAAGLDGRDGDGGPALEARLTQPQDMLVEATGEICIADWNNHTVRRIGADGVMRAFIATGFVGDTCGGPAASVQLNHPTDVALDPAGHFVVAAWHDDKIHVVNRNTLLDSCIAGTVRGFAGDGGPATQARLNVPLNAVYDGAGNLYILDQGNRRIRRVDTMNPPVITTFAGSGVPGFADGCGTAAQFNFTAGTNAEPGGKLALSPDGSFLYVSDSNNHRIRRVELATACVTTFAGTGVPGFSGDGGPAASAQFTSPWDIAFGPDGSLYVADTFNHRVRRIGTGGTIETVAGNGTPGLSQDGLPARQAMLNTPSGVFVTSDNTLFIADKYNHQIKKVRNP